MTEEMKTTEKVMEDMSNKSNGKGNNGRGKAEDNVIFIGNNPFMNYVTGVVMQFNTKGSDEVIVKARGKFISRAVDVAEVARNKFLKESNVKIGNISIGSEEFENNEGKKINVSIIEITMKKG